MNTQPNNKTGEGNAPRTLSTCKHCGRGINLRNGVWIDPQAKGDDAMWSETCDSHDTFTAEHEPVLLKQDANARDVHNETREDLERLADDAANLRSEMGAEIKRLTTQRDELLAALTKIAEREWQGEDKTWRSEAIEMQDEARAAISKAEQP